MGKFFDIHGNTTTDIYKIVKLYNYGIGYIYHVRYKIAQYDIVATEQLHAGYSLHSSRTVSYTSLFGAGYITSKYVLAKKPVPEAYKS